MRRGHLVVTLLAAAIAASACSGSAANGHGVTPESFVEDDATASVKEYHRYHHHGGVVLFVAMSLDTLGVSTDQQAAVDAIRLELHHDMEPARLTERRLMLMLADGLDLGNLDATKVDAALLELRAANTAVLDASAPALNRLHALLTAPQRAALVDKVAAHASVFQRANTETDDGQLANLTGELHLSEDQVEKMRAGLGDPSTSVPKSDWSGLSADVQAFGRTFRSDPFDARQAFGVGEPRPRPGGVGSAHLANLVEAALLVLTPDQRTELAARLREHAAHLSLAEQSP